MVVQKVRLDCGECDGPSVGGSVRCCATRRWRREEADTCSETHHPRHIPPSLGRITLHTNIIHYTYRSHQPGNVWSTPGQGVQLPGRSFPSDTYITSDYVLSIANDTQEFQGNVI